MTQQHSTPQLVDPDPFSIALGIIGAIGSIGWIYDKVAESHDRKAARKQARNDARQVVRSIRSECRELSEACEDLIIILRNTEVDGISAINKMFRFGATKIFLDRQQMGEVILVAAKVGGSFAKLHSNIQSLLVLYPHVAAEAQTRLAELNVDVMSTLNELLHREISNQEALLRLTDLTRKIDRAFDFYELDDDNF
jgi:hypothetical protein